jgi:hypothetical protein
VVASSANAHHSYSEYDDKQIVEVEGRLVRVARQNPHVHFYVEGIGTDGRAVTWDLESLSLNWLLRTKIPPELLEVGSQVKFAGWPSTRSPARMYSLNMLAENGQEILLFRTATLRWRDTAIGYAGEEAQSFYQDGIASDTVTLFAPGPPIKAIWDRRLDPRRRSRTHQSGGEGRRRIRPRSTTRRRRVARRKACRG